MSIINKAKIQLPTYMLDAFLAICEKAHLSPDSIDLIIKRRKRYIGDCWIKKGNTSIPSGLYKMDYRTVVVRISKKTHPDDFRFVLAHKIGHLVDHLAHRDDKGYDLTQQTATDFATNTCGCFPHSKYRGIKKAIDNHLKKLQ